MYDYSKRISENEERIAELKGQLITVKLSIQSLENENKRCFEAMNNLTQPIDVDSNKKDKEILNLTNQLKESSQTIKKLKKRNKELKVNVSYLEQKVDELQLKNICKPTKRDDVILSDNFGKTNIFEKIKS